MAVTRKQFVNKASDSQNSYWIADTAAETVTGAVEGDVKYAKDTDSLYSYDGAAWDAVGSSTGTGRFGTGSDGTCALDGTNQFSWCTLSGSTYTMLRDVNATTMTISSGITLRPLGCAIFATVLLDNSGTIEWNGNAASGATAGTAENGVARVTATLAGGAGTTNTAGSGAVGAASTADKTLSPGKGGGGGPGDTGRIGGLGGTLDPPSGLIGGPLQWDNVVAGFPYLIDVTTASRGTPQFGTGGGAGAGAASGVSGGGGAGGGLIIIAAKTITNQASGIISAKGGAGGNGSGTGPVGGGGGGGGGSIYLIYDTYTNSGSVTVAGGAGGTGSGTTDLTSGPLPSTDQVTVSDTDASYYTASHGLNNQGTLEFLTIVNTKSGGGDIPTSVTRKSGFSTPDAWLMENGVYTQLATVVNGDQRMTLYWTRSPMNVGDGSYLTIAVKFPATQTSCAIRTTAWAGGAMTQDVTIQEVQTGTATASTTLSINLAGPVIGGYEVIWTAVQANVTISKEAAWTANLAAGALTAPAGNNRGAYFRGGTDTTAAMTTAANQDWVGIAIDIRSASGKGEQGFAGRIVQIPA